MRRVWANDGGVKPVNPFPRSLDQRARLPPPSRRQPARAGPHNNGQVGMHDDARINLKFRGENQPFNGNSYF